MNTAGNALPWRHALPAGAINAAINGWISWGQFSHDASVPLTLDSISGGAHSAMGSAVMVATALGVILTLVNFAATHRQPGEALRAGKPVFGLALRTALWNGLALFGLMVVVGVLWQRAVGSVEVSPLAATALVALVAGGVSVYLAVATRAAYFRASSPG